MTMGTVFMVLLGGLLLFLGLLTGIVTAVIAFGASEFDRYLKNPPSEMAQYIVEAQRRICDREFLWAFGCGVLTLALFLGGGLLIFFAR